MIRKLFLLIIILTGILSQDLIKSISLPEGYFRKTLSTDSFQSYLRKLELSADNTVYLFNGSKKYSQSFHYAVLNFDIGKKNLQQCADALIRLRAEYLYKKKQFDKIAFNFTSGDRYKYSAYINGIYPVVNGNKVKFKKGKSRRKNYKNFRAYLDLIFTYAGTYSLKKESVKLKSTSELRIGDFYIQGGFPGHAMLVVDIAENDSGEKIFLLAQSYMPAQSVHIVKNPGNPGISPWYKLKANGKLITPEWTFNRTDLYRFRN